MRLRGKIAIVTGASRGIGRASALALAREGAVIVGAARTRADLDTLASEIASLGGRARMIPTDVTSGASVRACVEETLRTERRIDILVNNAGIGGYRPFLEWCEDG